MPDFKLSYDEWSENLRRWRGEELFAEPSTALQSLKSLSDYAEAAYQVTGDRIWLWRARWGYACEMAAHELIRRRAKWCDCGGKPDADTWERLEGSEPDDFDWWGADKRIEAIHQVGDDKVRAVVWVDTGGGDADDS